MRKHFLSVFLVTGLCHFAVAQHNFNDGYIRDFRAGYIIELNGDSVTGWIDYQNDRLLAKICSFKKNRTGVVIDYDPSEIKAYGFQNDKRFESSDLPESGSKSVFAQILIHGKMSLYKYHDVFYLYVDHFIKLPPNEYVEVHNDDGRFMQTKYPSVEILNMLMVNCPLPLIRFKYSERDISYMVQHYNSCKGTHGTEYKNTKPWNKISLEVLAGIDISSLKIDGLKSSTFQKDYSPVVGIGIEVSSPRTFDRLFFSIQGLYSQKVYLGFLERSLGSSVQRLDFKINYTAIRFPFGLRYNFQDDFSTPYLRLGIAPYISTKSTIQTISETENNSVVTTDYYDGVIAGKRQLGVWFGAGYTYTFYSKFKVFAEVRFERGNGFIGEDFFEDFSNTGTLSFLVGIRY